MCVLRCTHTVLIVYGILWIPPAAYPSAATLHVQWEKRDTAGSGYRCTGCTYRLQAALCTTCVHHYMRNHAVRSWLRVPYGTISHTHTFRVCVPRLRNRGTQSAIVRYVYRCDGFAARPPGSFGGSRCCQRAQQGLYVRTGRGWMPPIAGHSAITDAPRVIPRSRDLADHLARSKVVTPACARTAVR